MLNKEIPIYCAFPDGIYHYVCRECTTVCCRNSHHFDGDLQGELRHLLPHYPALQYVAIQRRGDALTFAAPSGQCFFLSEENRCRIELAHGKALKPTTCTLFPFHNLSRLGRAVIVTPNFLCPLRMEIPLRPGEVEGTHAKIEAALRASHYLRHSFLVAIPQLAICRGEKRAQVLSREIAFRDACTVAIGRRSFAEMLRSFSIDRDQLDASVKPLATVLNLELPLRSDKREEIDDLLLAISPAYRLTMLDLSSEAILRLLALSELVLRRILTLTIDTPRGAGDAATPKGATEILTKIGPALRLLAMADEPIKTRKGAIRKIPPFGDPRMTFAAHRILRKAESGELTWPIWAETLGTLSSVADRMVLLGEVSPLLKSEPRLNQK